MLWSDEAKAEAERIKAMEVLTASRWYQASEEKARSRRVKMENALLDKTVGVRKQVETVIQLAQNNGIELSEYAFDSFTSYHWLLTYNKIGFKISISLEEKFLTNIVVLKFEDQKTSPEQLTTLIKRKLLWIEQHPWVNTDSVVGSGLTRADFM